MSFRDEIKAWPEARLYELYEGVGANEVEAALKREERTLADLAALLSPAALPYLEQMAQEAQRLTRWHFGRTISLYVPLYISNLCAADCVYCGFAARSGSREKRITLSPDEIRRECEMLAKHGFQNVLILTGESPKICNVDYIAESVAIAKEYFAGVSVEIYALDQEDYARLAGLGLEGVTLYMETYDQKIYKEVHLLGDKMNYDYRIEAIERAGKAGVRKLNIGALLGLSDWRLDVLWTALHARYLEKHCWQSSLSVSFPRLLHTPERYKINHKVDDITLVQIILALRLFLPEAGFNLSTREAPAFRDKLIPLGITSMSAGSSTRPGGYSSGGKTASGKVILEQFALEDLRSVEEVITSIEKAGYDPVWKDFDHAFDR